MVQSKLSFTNPIIKKLDYCINLKCQCSKDEQINITNSFKVNVQRVENKNEALVELNIVIGDEPSTPFYIDMIVCAVFKWEDSYEEKTVIDLLSINAPALLLGYARPMVAAITNMSPFPVYNLPFYNFTE